MAKMALVTVMIARGITSSESAVSAPCAVGITGEWSCGGARCGRPWRCIPAAKAVMITTIEERSVIR